MTMSYLDISVALETWNESTQHGVVIIGKKNLAEKQHITRGNVHKGHEAPMCSMPHRLWVLLCFQHTVHS